LRYRAALSFGSSITETIQELVPQFLDGRVSTNTMMHKHIAFPTQTYIGAQGSENAPAIASFDNNLTLESSTMPPRHPFTFISLLLLATPSLLHAAEPIGLDVDASEVAKRVIHVRLTVPSEANALTLHYPRWIPGRHRPVGQVANVSGLRVHVGEEPVLWQRDGADPFTIHGALGQAKAKVEVHFDLLLAAGSEGGAAFMTVASPKVMTMNWNDVLMYPKSEIALQLPYAPTLRLPAGWKYGSALPADKEKDGLVTFKTVSLDTLIDSPVLAGEHVRIVPIGSEKDRHRVVLACDSPDGLEVPSETKAAWDRLPAEAAAMFGTAKPYENYTFLLGLSNHIPTAGIEHHQSSDNRLPELALIKSTERRAAATLLPHEYTHSWNGKYRRPADMIMKDYQTPQQTRLLWVYEGLTNYIGWVLAARCGLFTPEDAREYLALTASRMNNSRGRAWRPLSDTATAANVLFDAPRSWRSSRRAVDFYDEGTLLWLEVDVLIRTKTKGAKSVEDFCRAFFGGGESKPAVIGYSLDDLVKALNIVVENDWKTFFLRRVDMTAESPPLEGIAGAGWKLGYAEKPSDLFAAQEGLSKGVNLADSIGLLLTADGTVGDVVPDMPASKAGLAPGMKIIAVNSRRYTSDGLKSAVAHTKNGDRLELLAESGDFFRTHAVEYSGGAKYPRLERVGSQQELLVDILKAKTK
jgi:predicted metalloprotease with PDZ domain